MGDREIYWINVFKNSSEVCNIADGGVGGMRGETHPTAIYTKEQYISVMEALAYTDISMVELSKELNISLAVIGHISEGRSHQYLAEVDPEAYKSMRDKNGNRPRRKYTDEQYYKVIYLLSTGLYTTDSISKYTLVSSSVIKNILRGDTHRDLEQAYPEEYAKMALLRGNRTRGSRKNNIEEAVDLPWDS
jgi:hypothetical protein